MNKSIKGMLLSALIFPGVGQISMGYKKRGWFIIFLNVVFLYLIISNIIQQASIIAEKLQNNGVELNYELMSNQTSRLISFSDNSYLNILFVLLIISWVIAVVDAYFLGKK